MAEAVAVGGPAPVGLDHPAGDPVEVAPRRQGELAVDARLELRRSRPPGRGRRAGTPRDRARPARRRRASGSCRSGSRRPGRRSRRGRPRRPGRPHRTARRGAAPRSAPTRHVGSNATASAPPVRISHSSSSARSCSVAPGRIFGRSAASARSATAQAAATRSSSAGSLIARSASIQPSIGTSSTSGAAASRRRQVAYGSSAASTPTRRAPTDATSAGHAAARSRGPSTIRASGASRPAWIV